MIEDFLRDAGQALGSLTYGLVALLVFLETGAFLGFVLPGETAIMVGGLVAGQGRISILGLIAVVWLAAIAGDLTSFTLGRRRGRGFLLRRGARVGITEARFARVEAFFARHGAATILLGRWVGFVRPMMPFVAGSSGMPLGRFLAYDVLGVLVWGALNALLGFVFWRSFDQLASWASRGSAALAAVVALVVLVVVAVRNRSRIARRLRPWAVAAWDALVRALKPVVAAGLAPALSALVAVAVAAGLVFLDLLDEVEEGELTALDARGADAAEAVGSRAVVDLAEALTVLGSTVVLVPLTAVVVGVLYRRGRPLAAVTLVAGLAALQVHRVLKPIIERPRPPDPLIEIDGWAFPSGHATQAVLWVAFALVLARGRRRAVVLAGGLLVAVAIGLTRVQLRVHFLSDVLAGWALGTALLGLCGAVAVLVAARRTA